MEKVRGKVFAAFFQELRGKISSLIIALLLSANYHLSYWNWQT